MTGEVCMTDRPENGPRTGDFRTTFAEDGAVGESWSTKRCSADILLTNAFDQLQIGHAIPIGLRLK